MVWPFALGTLISALNWYWSPGVKPSVPKSRDKEPSNFVTSLGKVTLSLVVILVKV